MHAFHAAGWTKERLNEFRRTARHEFSKARAEPAPMLAQTNQAASGDTSLAKHRDCHMVKEESKPDVREVQQFVNQPIP